METGGAAHKQNNEEGPHTQSKAYHNQAAAVLGLEVITPLCMLKALPLELLVGWQRACFFSFFFFDGDNNNNDTVRRLCVCELLFFRTRATARR